MSHNEDLRTILSIRTLMKAIRAIILARLRLRRPSNLLEMNRPGRITVAQETRALLLELLLLI